MTEEGSRLPLMEAFYTVQGEGFYQGYAAYFIRLGGCDVGCVWCDVKESWEAEKHPETEVDSIVEAASRYPGKLAVITGGEPCMYDLQELTARLQSRGIKTHLETSGAHPLSGSWDWICFSPKKFMKPRPEFYTVAHELKVVIYNKSDFKWAEEHARQVNKECKLFLQPEWDKSDEMLPLITDYIKEHPQWQISLQIHKFMDIP